MFRAWVVYSVVPVGLSVAVWGLGAGSGRWLGGGGGGGGEHEQILWARRQYVFA